MPQVDTGTLYGDVASNGPLTPYRQTVSIYGPPSKSKTLNGNGSYSFADIPAKTYSMNDYLYFNNYKQYFRVPYSAFSPASTNRRYEVKAGKSTKVDISYDQSVISGKVKVTGSAPLSEFKRFRLYAYGIYNTPTYGGYGQTNDTNTSTGQYQLILSEGSWNINNIYLYFNNNSSDPDEYLNSQIYYSPRNQSKLVSTSPSQPGTKDFTLPTGEVTVTFRIAGNTGTTMSNPRLSRSCTKKDANGNIEYTYNISASNYRQQNVEVGKVRFFGLAGTCKLTARATVGGGTTTFGEVVVEVVPGTSQVVDIGGPSLTIASPSPDYITSNSSISISGTVTDDVEVAGVTVNGTGATLTSTNNSSDPNEMSFSSTVALVKGPNLITTIATDTANPANTTSDKRTVYRDSGVPTLSFTPADKTIVASSGSVTNVTLSGTADDDAGIKSVVIQGVTVSFTSTGNGNEVKYSATLELTDGDNFIEVVVTDISNRSTTETHKVTVSDVDTTPPVITAPADMTVSTDAGQPYATVSFATATATDNSGSVSVSQTGGPAPGSQFPIGTTTITWTAMDPAGNLATASMTVTVVDNEAPVITVPANVTEEATGPQTSAAIGQATATDNVGVVSITSDAPATFPVGTTTVTWTATDGAGNSSTATQTVTVADTTAPAITAPAGVTAEATGPQTTVATGTATGTDAVGPVTITSDAPAAFPVGTTTVTWTATDGAGNSSTATQTVTVVDTTAPAITAPADVTADATGPLTSVDIGNATASDLVGVVSLTNDAPVDGFPVDSTTTVTWTATDAAGNSSTATQTVTVKPFLLTLNIEKAKVKLHPKDPNKDKIKIKGRYKEFANGDGLNLSEAVVMVNGVTLSGAKFKENGKFEIKGKRMNLRGIDFSSPVTLSIRIGNDLGESSISFDSKGKFEDEDDKEKSSKSSKSTKSKKSKKRK
ncbi:hypothetical protein UZ36_07335 [Candidatus Nitromaritima sp. SCGC AAA799-C22]|nr:hypothetical protein UZ36_07335 [Candidatus Nitromaritima sp. SCGC AAA799-C22]